jgi:hypothetical protein
MLVHDKSGDCCLFYDRTIPSVVGWTRDLPWLYPQLPSLLAQNAKTFHARVGLYHEQDLPYMATIRRRQRRLRPSSSSSPQTTKTATITYARDGNSSNNAKKKRNQPNATNYVLPNGLLIYYPAHALAVFATLDRITSCHRCREECGCYCTSHVPEAGKRPSSYPWPRKLSSNHQRYRRDPTWIMSRIIHPTWFEEIYVSKYVSTVKWKAFVKVGGNTAYIRTTTWRLNFWVHTFQKKYDKPMMICFRVGFKGRLCCYDVVYTQTWISCWPDVGFLAPFDCIVRKDTTPC